VKQLVRVRRGGKPLLSRDTVQQKNRPAKELTPIALSLDGMRTATGAGFKRYELLQAIPFASGHEPEPDELKPSRLRRARSAV